MLMSPQLYFLMTMNAMIVVTMAMMIMPVAAWSWHYDRAAT